MSSGFIGWGGMAGMVGGALWALTPLREPLLGGRFPEHPVFRPYNLVLLVIVVLLAAGLSALHARYGGRYGRLGTAGVVVILWGTRCCSWVASRRFCFRRTVRGDS